MSDSNSIPQANCAAGIKLVENPEYRTAKYRLGKWIEDCYDAPFHFLELRSNDPEFLDNPCRSKAIEPAIRVTCDANDPDRISLAELFRFAEVEEYQKHKKSILPALGLVLEIPPFAGIERCDSFRDAQLKVDKYFKDLIYKK